VKVKTEITIKVKIIISSSLSLSRYILPLWRIRYVILIARKANIISINNNAIPCFFQIIKPLLSHL